VLAAIGRRITHHPGRRADCGSSVPGAVVIGGDYQGLGIARSLGQHGIPVCVVDDETCIARASRFVKHVIRVRDLNTEASLLAALALARQRLGGPRCVLYPTRDSTVATIADSRDRLTHDFRVPTPGMSAIRHAWDKRQTYRLGAQLSIAIPRTWFPQSEQDLARIPADGPLILKPAIKEHFYPATHVKAWRVDCRAQLVRSYRRAAAIIPPSEIMVQELIPGGGQEQYAYCAFFRCGHAVASMTVRRRRQHPSEIGHASTYVETIALPELEGPSLRWLHAAGYYGLVELEYKRDPRDGTYKLLDVNARTWGYHSLGQAAGVDFPYVLYRDQVGDPVEGVRARPGVRWIRLHTDVPNAFNDVRAGKQPLREYLRSLRQVDTEAVYSFSDPLPGLYEIALLPYLAVKRGL
jgi:D-aspartate ligase